MVIINTKTYNFFHSTTFEGNCTLSHLYMNVIQTPPPTQNDHSLINNLDCVLNSQAIQR